MISLLRMIVTTTSVDAEPIGVRLPPRFAPKIADHQYGEVDVFRQETRHVFSLSLPRIWSGPSLLRIPWIWPKLTRR